MLRQPRPKSQPPPAAKFKQTEEDWTSKLMARYSGTGDASSIVDCQLGAGKLELESSSSASSPSSSSSSLASSSLSLSTNSSTSTVLLAALNSNRQQPQAQQMNPTAPVTRTGGSKQSMIARYSANGSLGVLEGQQQKVQQLETSSDEEDPSQVLSSTSSASSTSSSSSGLSSMNSANSSNGSRRPDKQQYSDTVSSGGALVSVVDDDDEVRDCLSELVDSVVARGSSSSSGSEDDDTPYGHFQLHQVHLAKTRSSTSASSDDDSSAAIKVFTGANQAAPRSLTAAAHLVRRLGLERGADEAAIVRVARHCLEGIRQRASWLVGLRPNDGEAHIEWRSSQPESSGQLSLGQVAACLVDEQLVIWLLGSHPSDEPASASELETTLDDIALALDEPIERPPVGSQSEALIWWCASKSEAREFGDIYRSLVEGEHSAAALAAQSEQGTADGSNPQQDSYDSGSGSSACEDELNRETDVRVVSSVALTESSPPTAALTNDNDLFASERNQLKQRQQQQQGEQQVKSAPATELTPGEDIRSPAEQQKQRPVSSKQQAKVLDHHAHQQQQPQPQTAKTSSKSAESRGRGQERTSGGAGGPSPAALAEAPQQQQSALNSAPTTNGKCLIETTSSEARSGEPKKKDKRQTLTKSAANSASSTDLSAAAASPGIASYYKSMASKVISNGQSKIRSFKDEMIKLNSRAAASSSASAAATASKRVSLVVQPATAAAKPNGSTLNLSLLDSAATKSSEPTSQRAGSNPGGHQLRMQPQPQAEQQAAKTRPGEQVPAVKPRTSILKNRKQQQNNGCDINNNNNEDTSANEENNCRASRQRADPLRTQRAASDKQNNGDDQPDAEQQQQQQHLHRSRAAESSRARVASSQAQAQSSAAASRQQAAPKSILKSSKSVSNLIAGEDDERLYPSSRVSSNSAISGGSSQATATRPPGGILRHSREELAGSYSDVSAVNRRSCATEKAAHYYTMRRAPDSSYEKKRRSAYSLAPDTLYGGSRSSELDHDEPPVGRPTAGHQQLGPGEEEEEDEEAFESRQQAFERLRQRASCYDISRLMSKNGLQNQLNKLRAGSTSSITGKSRQRRPALLISDEQQAQRDGDDPLEAMGQVTSGGSASGRSSERARGKTPATGHPEDAYNSSGLLVSAQGGRRQLRQVQVGPEADHHSFVAPNAVTDDSSLHRQSKKSEFDPRSLRRLPVGMSRSEDVEEAHSRPKSGATKAMTSIIRLGGSQAKQQQQQEQEKKAEPETAQKKRVDLTSVVSLDKGERKQSAAKQQQQKGDSQQTGEEDEDEDEDTATDSDATQTETEPETLARATSSLSKSGPFSLLRQSFNQKTLSSMLKFSGRASLRIKSSAPTAGEHSTGGGDQHAAQDKASAIAIAEANLLAAKQLKQQAQRLKEQQKREQVAMDPTSMMLAAVQYNQHLQRQHQHQQHQHQQQQHQQQHLLYRQQAQQYAVAASRGQMFDATGMHMQHQMLIQRHHQQQQQQLAYMAANLNSQTHYMAQQMVMSSPASMALGPMGAAQQLMYAPPLGPSQLPVQQPSAAAAQSSGIFRKSILKGHKTAPGAAALSPELVYAQQQQQQQQQQQLIPMAVNHHSSFNIVYAGAAPAPLAPQLQQQAYEEHHPVQQQLPAAKPASTKSSLGASMRKTVKSILVNRSAFLSSSAAPAGSSVPSPQASKSSQQQVSQQQVEPKLKSALKQVAAREMALNSEGSDNDGSTSSDSTTITLSAGPEADSRSAGQAKPPAGANPPKSALKKSTTKVSLLASSASSSSSSDSSCSSSSSSEGLNQPPQVRQSMHLEKSATSGGLSRNYNYRQSVRINATPKRSQEGAAKQRESTGTGRKNVTFSTKLTLIL